MPSIGGLIYALEQRASTRPFTYAYIAAAVWGAVALAFGWAMLSNEMGSGAGFVEVMSRPATFLLATAILVPPAIFYFLALLTWRADELRLRSSTMTEVAVRLAEPDRMAEQSVASLGQAVRRQVSFMNDAVLRALGRAGELEALVHSEVASLERSYEENERRIRNLIQELSGERHALLTTSERVTETLRSLGSEVPNLIDKLSHQQVKLAQIVEGAGANLNNLESAITQSVGRLETTLGARTEHLQTVLTEYTEALGGALGSRTEEMQTMLETYTGGLASALGSRTEQMKTMIEQHTEGFIASLGGRTENLQIVFEEYARALDTTLANRAQALDVQLVERTRSLDAAFSERLRLFDDSIKRSTAAIDTAVVERSRALTTALDRHAKSLQETVGRQTVDLDEALMHGINSVRRSSETITKQSLKAIEGLAGQSELLKNVSENLLGQINSVTNRFENQGQSILMAANALESANYKIDSTLQTRHGELTRTLDRMTGKADEFGRFVEDYSSTIEGSLSEAELRARTVAEELRANTESRQRTALADLERMKAMTDAESDRALEDLRRRFSTVSGEVSRQLGTLSTQFDETSEDMRQRAARTAAELMEEERRLKEQVERLPTATRESASHMRRAIEDQMRALESLASITARSAVNRDVVTPIAGGTLTSAYVAETRSEPPDIGRARALAASPQPQDRAGAAAGMGGGSAEGWSLGDLLARASRDEEGREGRSSTPQSGGSFPLDLALISRSIDPATASAIWSRVRNGQRGVMVRSIYSAEGRVAFDETSRRYKSDSTLQENVQYFLAEFERLIADSDQNDPAGRATQAHLVSESGRVYLFLAHASGRLA